MIRNRLIFSSFYLGYFHLLFQLAGILSLISNEVSAFTICLITLDRFIVLRFPFTQTRFRPTSALVASVICWMVGILVALFPLLVPSWRIYGQSGVCVPLPVTRKRYPGHTYSFSIFIVLNFILFILVALGQIGIFLAVRETSKSMEKGKSKPMDMRLAYRLVSIVVTDFLCWFPLGLLGLLAWRGVAVPGEVNVAMVTFVMPLNSALNPFLYTLNMVLEKRREKYYAKLMATLEARVRAQIKGS